MYGNMQGAFGEIQCQCAVNDNFKLRSLNRFEINSLKSVILFKATTLRTTESWVKERAERHFNVWDLFALDAPVYNAAIEWLLGFED